MDTKLRKYLSFLMTNLIRWCFILVDYSKSQNKKIPTAMKKQRRKQWQETSQMRSRKEVSQWGGERKSTKSKDTTKERTKERKKRWEGATRRKAEEHSMNTQLFPHYISNSSSSSRKGDFNSPFVFFPLHRNSIRFQLTNTEWRNKITTIFIIIVVEIKVLLGDAM